MASPLTKRAAWACLVPISLLISAGACNDHDAYRPADSGVSPGTVEAGPLCAKDIAAGDICPAEGTTCLASECATGFIVCTSGIWREVARVLTFSCPASIPVEGQSCPACWPKNRRCTYGDVGCSPGQNYTIMSCDQKWTAALGPCSDDAGPADSGVADGPQDAKDGG